MNLNISWIILVVNNCYFSEVDTKKSEEVWETTNDRWWLLAHWMLVITTYMTVKTSIRICAGISKQSYSYKNLSVWNAVQYSSKNCDQHLGSWLNCGESTRNQDFLLLFWSTGQLSLLKQIALNVKNNTVQAPEVVQNITMSHCGPHKPSLGEWFLRLIDLLFYNINVPNVRN